MRFPLYCLLLAGSILTAAETGEWEAARKAALERPRRVIYNNDGDDATWYPKNLPVTPENFLSRRLRTMEGSRVDGMFYVVQISFTTTTFDSKVGRMLQRNTQTPAAFAANPELVRQGTDPFRLAVDYCHANGKEIFASFRMNDIHDSWWAPGEKNRWVWLFPEFKREHPELLFGSQQKRPPFGAWSAVDYESPIVREKLLRLVEEVCDKYEWTGWSSTFSAGRTSSRASAGEKRRRRNSATSSPDFSATSAPRPRRPAENGGNRSSSLCAYRIRSVTAAASGSISSDGWS